MLAARAAAKARLACLRRSESFWAAAAAVRRPASVPRARAPSRASAPASSKMGGTPLRRLPPNSESHLNNNGAERERPGGPAAGGGPAGGARGQDCGAARGGGGGDCAGAAPPPLSLRLVLFLCSPAQADARDEYTDVRLLRYVLSFKGNTAKAASAIAKVMPFRLQHADLLAAARTSGTFAFGVWTRGEDRRPTVGLTPS